MQQISFDKRSGKIWFNNELCEWQDARVHIISHGMHYASLVFEGLRVYNSKIFKLEEHTDRLFKSAKILDMKIPYSYVEIIQATKKLVSDQSLSDISTFLLGLSRELATSKTDNFIVDTAFISSNSKHFMSDFTWVTLTNSCLS